jgi:hypothetical protein
MIIVCLIGAYLYYRSVRKERRERERVADGFSGYGNKEMFARCHSSRPEDRAHVNAWKTADRALQRAGARRTRDHDAYLLILGCTQAELARHIEKSFQPGMMWSNYGEWHVDHIRPCASFNLAIPSQQAICFHYTNLQALWGPENMSKRDRYCRVPGDLAETV